MGSGGGGGVGLPLLARCRMVSICSPDSFAFFIADVARGQPDKLGDEKEMPSVVGLGRGLSPEQGPWTRAQVWTPGGVQGGRGGPASWGRRPVAKSACLTAQQPGSALG